MNTDTENMESATVPGEPAAGEASILASREGGEAESPQGAETIPQENIVVEIPQSEKRPWIPNTKNSPMARFKARWRTQMTDEEKEYWIEQLGGRLKTNAAMLIEIRDKCEIEFSSAPQISKVRKWVEFAHDLMTEAEKMREEERHIKEEFPNATKEEIRAELLKRTYTRVYCRGDFELFVKAAKADVQIDMLNLHREKFKESVRAKIKAGIDSLREEAGKNPVVKAAVEQIRAAMASE